MGITARTRNRIVFGAGNITVDGVDIGATTGKTILRVVQELYEPHFDGVLGPLEQSLHRTRLVASLECTAVEFQRTDLMSMFHPDFFIITGTDSWAEGMWGEICWGGACCPLQTLELCITNYNVVWTGEDCDGDPITVTLENAAQIKELSVAFKDTEETKFELKFLTTYDPADPEHIPFGIVVGTS